MNKQKKNYSPHISIKRLRDLADKYAPATEHISKETVKYVEVLKFISYVESQRPFLRGGNPKKAV